ncbi:MAG: ABC transporter substrate-binding protein [Halarsenatibacteraceae bacterium]
MRKIIITSLILGLLVAGFAANVQAQVEIKYWHAMSGLTEDFIAETVDRFNELNDDIHVEVEYQGSYRDVMNATQAAIRTGNAPHVIQSFEISTQQLIDMDIFIPLEDTLDDVDWDAFIEPVTDYYRVDGKLYSMPYNSSNPILYYNKDIFEEAGLDPERPPQTYSEMIEYSKQIVESGAARHGFVMPLHGWFFEQWMANIGGEFVDNNNGRSGRATSLLLGQEAEDIMEWWKTMYDNEYYVNPGVENWSQSRQIFASQQAAMAIDSTAAVNLKLNAGEDQGFEVGTGFMPIHDDYERHGTVIGGGSLWVVDGHSDADTEAAGRLIRFLSSAEEQVEWHKNTGYFPVHKDSIALLEEENWFEDNPAYKTALDQLQQTRQVTATQGALIGNFPEIRTIVTDAVQDIFQEERTIEEALERAMERAESAMNEYNRVMGVE